MINNKGFSLVATIVASGILGGLSYAFLHLLSSQTDMQIRSQGGMDHLLLKEMINRTINDSDNCRISFAGNGTYGTPSTPIVFKRDEIDEIATEGLDVALYLANQTKTARQTKLLNGADNVGTDDKSRFSINLKVLSLKLIMNNGTGNYANEPYHTDTGILRATIERRLSTKSKRTEYIDIRTALALSTGQPPESSGQTRIIGCSGSSVRELRLPMLVTPNMQSHAHGLGRVPQDFSIYLENVTAEPPYNPGDRLKIGSYMNQFGGTSWGMGVSVTATHVNIHMSYWGTNTVMFRYPNPSGGAHGIKWMTTQSDLDKWRMIIVFRD